MHPHPDVADDGIHSLHLKKSRDCCQMQSFFCLCMASPLTLPSKQFYITGGSHQKTLLTYPSTGPHDGHQQWRRYWGWLQKNVLVAGARPTHPSSHSSKSFAKSSSALKYIWHLTRSSFLLVLLPPYLLAARPFINHSCTLLHLSLSGLGQASCVYSCHQFCPFLSCWELTLCWFWASMLGVALCCKQHGGGSRC